VLALHRFPAQQRSDSSQALELMTKLKIDAHRTASGTQGRLRGALTSQEIANLGLLQQQMVGCKVGCCSTACLFWQHTHRQ